MSISPSAEAHGDLQPIRVFESLPMELEPTPVADLVLYSSEYDPLSPSSRHRETNLRQREQQVKEDRLSNQNERQRLTMITRRLRGLTWNRTQKNKIMIQLMFQIVSPLQPPLLPQPQTFLMKALPRYMLVRFQEVSPRDAIPLHLGKPPPK